jgi:hypothetical protein
VPKLRWEYIHPPVEAEYKEEDSNDEGVDNARVIIAVYN